MATLATPLVMPLGGSGAPGQPYIVNVLPGVDDTDVAIDEAIRMTVRDKETFIDPTSIIVRAGYTKTYADGSELFTSSLPRTFILNSSADPINGDADIEVTVDGVRITKTSDDPQRSVFFTSVDVGTGIRSVGASAKLRPEVSTIGGGVNGTVFGMEVGPRNTGVYLFFIDLGTIPMPMRMIRVTGPDVGGTRVPDLLFAYSWLNFQRYFLIWNEAIGELEIFVSLGEASIRVTSIPIASFQQFGTTGIGTPRRGKSTDVTVVYGQEGPTGDRSTFAAINVTPQIDVPLIGGAIPGNYLSQRVSAEVVGFRSEDPRIRELSPWFDSIPTVFPSEDPNAIKEVVGDSFRISRLATTNTASVYRDEPGFARSFMDGFLLEAKVFGIPSLKFEAGTGMGIVISDRQSIFQLNMLDDGFTRSIGLLKRNGIPTRGSGHFTPSTLINWSSPVAFRFTVDMRRNLIEMFLLPDIDNAILSIPFDRLDLPEAVENAWDGRTPFIAFGFILDVLTAGSMEVEWLRYSHLYQAWEGRDLVAPEASGVAYTKVGTGVDSFVDETLVLTTVPGEQLYYHREGILDPLRGSIVEARLQINSFKPLSPSGVYLVLDDTLHAYMMSFVETPVGKFVTISLAAGLSDVIEIAGTEGLPAKVSFPLDWTQEHLYRMEKRPNDGLYIFIDQSEEASLIILDRDMLQIAQTRQDASYPTPPFYFPPPGSPVNGAVAFGHFTELGAVSTWKYVRHTFSLGFEISTKKNLTTDELVDQIAGTQAMVAASVLDEDT